MSEKRNIVDYLKFELDGMTTIGIVGGFFFYERENYSEGKEEIEIPLQNIQKVVFKDKRVNREKTRNNLIGDFILTILNSGAHPTEIEYDKPELTVHFVNENGAQEDTLRISNRNMTKEIYDAIESKIN